MTVRYGMFVVLAHLGLYLCGRWICWSNFGMERTDAHFNGYCSARPSLGLVSRLLSDILQQRKPTGITTHGHALLLAIGQPTCFVMSVRIVTTLKLGSPICARMDYS